MYFYIYYKIGSSFWLWCMVHLLYLLVITYPLDDVTVIRKMSWEMNHETQWKKKLLSTEQCEHTFFFGLWLFIFIMIWRRYLYWTSFIFKEHNSNSFFLSFHFSFFHSKPNILSNACFTNINNNQQPKKPEKRAKKRSTKNI